MKWCIISPDIKIHSVGNAVLSVPSPRGIPMKYPQRKLHRLKNWDYCQPGYYHITICTKNRRPILCNIRQNELEVEVIPTEIGKIIQDNWNNLRLHYSNVKTDYFCLMPNHIHGIIIIEPSKQDQAKSLNSIVRGFKSVTTRAYNQLVSEQQKNTLWQASYYDEIIRNDQMLFDVRKYIYGNPSKWLEDELYVR